MSSEEISIPTSGRGLYLITDSVLKSLPDLPENGLLNCFIPHTSASLLIQENADPTAREDLEVFLNRLIPDGEAWHRHTLEGADDTTAHMKAALTSTSLNIPIREHRLALGTWQGIYLWEHRQASHQRRLLLTVI